MQLDPLDFAESWMLDGNEVVIATVIETWGSAPRLTGSQMVICDDGRFEGSVSGGCVEGAVIEAAADVAKSGEPTILAFDVADDAAWKVGLSCGGRIKIYLERVG
ncbi:MAG: XdhC family protein [Ahrensia sp.]|nr:XdhC family protein [Ahrensia sp.]